MSIIHLKPPKRHDPPRWLKRPLGKLQSLHLPWPRAWAAFLLIINGAAHLGRLAWVIVAQGSVTIPAVLVGLFGAAYLLMGVWLCQPGRRALWYAAIVTAIGLTLGTISFVTSSDQSAGVNWMALVMLLLDVLVVPLCAAGLQLPRAGRSATPPPHP